MNPTSTTGERDSPELRSLAVQLDVAGAYQRAAETHKRAADFYERAAAHDHRHGWHEIAERMEQHADQQREQAHYDQTQADRIRDTIGLPQTPPPTLMEELEARIDRQWSQQRKRPA
jgi:hypothetical protein